MALRYITGRSGQGKTEYLVKEVIRRSIEIPEKQYYVIVPEQFSLEMQRKIVKMHPRHGFFNIDVLSFHRLSYRIFAECNYQPKEILEDLGVSMMLRKILSEEEGDFLYFKKSMKKPGFIDELKSMLMEFIGYGVSWKQVEEVTKQLDENKSLCNKCEELGRIYERFEKAIEGRFMVTEQILDIAREFTGNAPMLKNAVFYFDGFAGFTPVQISFLRELLKVAAQINVTVTIPEFIPGQKGMSEDLFNASKKTADALLMLCKENMQEVEEIVNLREKIAPRFINNPEAAFLEQHLFQNNRESYDDFPERIHMTVCRNPDGEADYVMHKIEQLVRQKGYRYRDFAVLSGDVAEYASAFKRKAAILNIPVFEDTKKKVSYHSGVEAVRSLFHLAQMDYSYESVFRYLKSGMSDLMDEEADYLENYVLYAGIRGLSMWKKPFVRRLKNKEESMIKELHTLQERFMKETEHFCQVMRDKEVSVKDKMKALYLTMTELAFEEKFSYCAQKAEDAGDYVKATEYRQLYELLISLIDKIVMIFGEEKMTIKELGEIMDAGLDSLGLGVVPLSMDHAIENISFKAMAGQTIGIIGGTGSGKSTLVNLIPRFYDATEGEIDIAGENVREYTYESLRKMISVVPQKAQLFAGTIRDNLMFGCPDATEEQIEEALVISQAKEFVDTKEGRLDAVVEQGGKNLSGGQRQRLTLARALVPQSDILIMDDSASALDYATDAKLRKAIQNMKRKPTVFIVSQRTSSIQDADSILVLDDGKIAGKGTHEELIASCDIYREIYETQFKKEEA